MQLILQTANVTADAKNCSYPNKVTVTNASELQEAVKMDHVCAEYKNNYRSIDNFLKSNVVVMDLDNDHTDDPDEWITAEKLEELLPDISYAVAPSRNHMVAKNGKAARPKYHVYFEIEEMTDAAAYAALKAALHNAYPFFDGNALDAARFIFGADSGEAVWHEGWTTIDEEVVVELPNEETAFGSGPILEGNRNNAMSRFAGRVLKRYGNTEKAHDAFMEHAQKCDPPLSDEELGIIWASAIRFFNKKVVGQDGYVPPEEYNQDFDGVSLEPEDFSDIGEAKVLAREYEDELIYSDATSFLRYDGTCWRENKQDAVGAVEEFLDMQLVDARDELNRCIEVLVEAGLPEKVVKAGGKALEKLITPELEKAYGAYLAAKNYYAFVMKCRNFKNLVNVQNAVKPMIQIKVEDLDANENMLNTPDATYDLRKGMAGAMEHSPSDLLTKITTVSPGDKGKDLWEESLHLFFCGNQELIEYVQMTCGLAAIGKVYEEALIIAYGEGRNGKSTFWNTVSKVLGTYAGTISADTMTANCRRNVKPEIAELKGKRLAIAAELEEGMLLSTSVLKQVCSTDVVRGEKKFKDPFDYTPTHTVVLYTNHLPKVRATDEGTWRRLIVIPFHAKIEGKSDIKNYSDYLFENAGSYVLAWIIEGARKAIEADFHLERPKVVADAIAEYRGMNDWLEHFLEECCVRGDGLEEKSGELYQEYRSYCLRTGEISRNNADFTAVLEKAGYTRKKKKSGMWVQGLQLKDTDFAE